LTSDPNEGFRIVRRTGLLRPPGLPPRPREHDIAFDNDMETTVVRHRIGALLNREAYRPYFLSEHPTPTVAWNMMTQIEAHIWAKHPREASRRELSCLPQAEALLLRASLR
jgi:hypothetical protein